MVCEKTPADCPQLFYQDQETWRYAVLFLLANILSGDVPDTVTVENAGGADAVNIQDGGNSITIDGNVGLTVEGTISDGRKTVAAPGTPEALSPVLLPCSRVDVQALSTNTGVVVVGGATVVAAAGTRRGVALAANQVFSFSIDNLAKVFLDVTVAGEGVSYTYFV